MQMFPKVIWKLALKCKGRKEFDYKTNLSLKDEVDLGDLMVLSGRVIAQWIKVTLGITSVIFPKRSL